MQEAQIAELLRENKRLADDLRALKAELRDRIEERNRRTDYLAEAAAEAKEEIRREMFLVR